MEKLSELKKKLAEQLEVGSRYGTKNGLLLIALEALEFYAPKETYWGKDSDPEPNFPIDVDEGKKAREALAKILEAGT